jgi:hypothetical protein
MPTDGNYTERANYYPHSSVTLIKALPPTVFPLPLPHPVPVANSPANSGGERENRHTSGSDIDFVRLEVRWHSKDKSGTT